MIISVGLKNVLKILFALCVTLLVIFILIEVAVRLFVPQEENLFMADPYIRSIHKPNIDTIRVRPEYKAKIITNKQGFVGQDFSTSKEKDSYLIAALGDSFTEGFDVDFDKAFPKRLEDILNSKEKTTNDNTSYRVYNFGISSFSPTHELLAYENYAKKYNPDLILWQIYVGNDLSDEIMLRADPNDTSATTSAVAHTGFARAFLANYLQSPRFFIREISKMQAAREMMTKLSIISRTPEHFDTERDYPFFYDIYNVGEKTPFTDSWPMICDFVNKFQTETVKNNSKLLVLLIPAKEQVLDEEWDKLFVDYPSMKDKIWDRLLPLIKTRACLDNAGVQYVDMYSVLNANEQVEGKKSYYRTDLHFNDYGHELVAKELSKKIMSIR